MIRCFLSVVGLWAAALPAAEVTPEMASRAVKNWRATKDALECKFGKRVASARRCEAGEAKFNVVKLEGGGFVVTSADTAIRPIVCFSEGEDLDEDPRNPLYALVKKDLMVCAQAAANRQNIATLASVKPGGPAVGESTGDSANEREWAELLAEPDAARLANTVSTPSDIRVAPLLKSKWNQSTVSGKRVYNYYTPNNYVCGCVATATAQLMRYFEWPKSDVSIAQFTNPNCQVDGVKTTLTTQGGCYNWADMPLAPGSGITEVQQQAIGKLCSDLGIIMAMKYTSSGSGTGGIVPIYALKNVNGYSNAVGAAWYSGNDSAGSAYNQRIMMTNFDAKLPVLLGITYDDDGGGHEIVGDGYGYSGSTFCVHLNFGWGGSYNAWYAPPDIGQGTGTDACSIIDEVVYNIYTNQSSSCTIVSGRLVNGDGQAVSGVTVTAKRSNSTYDTAVSDAKGIFALYVPAPTSSRTTYTYNIEVQDKGYEGSTTAKPKQIKSATPSTSGGKPSGGSGWNNSEPSNVHLGDVQLNFTAVALIGDTSYTSLAAACNAAQAGQTITLVRNVTENPTIATACTLDFQGHTVNGVIYCTYNSTGGAVTLKNGTVTGNTDSFDGQAGSSATFPNGQVVFENMTMSGTIWSDSHPLVFTSGTYTGAVRAGSQNCTIDGGNFASLVKDGAGVFVVNDGRFAEDFSSVSSISSRMHWVDDGAGYYPWCLKEIVKARIGDTTYPSFAEACAAVQRDETVVLVEDDAEEQVSIGAGCIVDFGGHTFSGQLVCTNTVAITLMNGRITGSVLGLPEGTTGANGAINFTNLTTTGPVTLNRHAAVFRDGTYGTVTTGTGAVVVTNGCTMALLQGTSSGQLKVYADSSVTRIDQSGSGAVMVYGGEVGTIEGKGVNLAGGNVGSIAATSTVTGTGGNATTVNAASVRLSAGTFGTVTANDSGVCTLSNVVVTAYVHDSSGRLTVTGGKYGSFTVQSGGDKVTIKGGRFGTKPVGEYILGDGLHWVYDDSDAAYPWMLTDAVAKVGSAVYPTLDAACAAAANGDTVQLLIDDDEARVTVLKGGTIDLGGNTFAGELVCTNAASSTVAVGNGEVTGAVVNVGRGIVLLTNNCTVALLRGESGGQLRISPGCTVARVVQNDSGTITVFGGQVGSIEGRKVTLSGGTVDSLVSTDIVTGNGGDATTLTAAAVRLSAGDFGTITANGSSASTLTNVVVGAYVHAGTGKLTVNGGWFGTFTAQEGCGAVTVKGGYFKTQPTGEIILPEGWRWECVEGEEYPWRLTDAPPPEPPGPTPEEAMAKLQSGEVKMSVRQEQTSFVLRVEYAEEGLWYGFWGADELAGPYEIMPATFQQGAGGVLEIVAPPRQARQGYYKIGICSERP